MMTLFSVDFSSTLSLSPPKMMTLFSSLPSTQYLQLGSLHYRHRRVKWQRQPLKLLSMAKQESGDTSGGGIAEKVAIAGGLVSNPVIAWSLYTLKTTGCGLPPGPGGSLGAVEGVSYLIVLGIVGWSLYTKSKTGSGLPNGPFGLLGAVEGLSYLTLLAILVVFGLQYLEQGYIPGPLPADQCFG